MESTFTSTSCIVNTIRNMILIHLRRALDAYEAKTGERLTHDELAIRTGLARTTLDSIASRRGYNTSLKTIERICKVLRCEPHDILEMTSEDGGNGAEGA